MNISGSLSVEYGDQNMVDSASLLLSLSDAVDLANRRISRHQQRTAYIAWKISKSADLPDKSVKDIFIASLLHDIGAITVEEKVSLHNFENVNIINHCRRGEILLKRIPEFDEISLLVKYHHTPWPEWDDPLDTAHVIASQIIFLADYIERLINRDRHILHQTGAIIEKIKSLANTLIHPEVIKYFLESSYSEEFWLDLVSPKIFSLLRVYGPLKNVEIDFLRLDDISKLFRDVIDYKSPFTATHSSGVASCAEMMSRLSGFTDSEVRDMKIAGNLHDLGKLGIPNSILDKSGSLTRDEYKIVKSHAYYTYHVISLIPGLNRIAEWSSFHHEKLNGKGYPFHRDKSSLDTGARIMAVADIFTAITEDRPYRKGMPKDIKIKILNDMVLDGSLDPSVVSLLIDNYDDVYDYVKITQESAMEFYNMRMEFYGK